MATKRGYCPVCRYSHRLLVDGVLGWHYVYVGSEKSKCLGSYRRPVPLRPADRPGADRSEAR